MAHVGVEQPCVRQMLLKLQQQQQQLLLLRPS
jgi:hypothetical protein